jgi:hypothetical protein
MRQQKALHLCPGRTHPTKLETFAMQPQDKRRSDSSLLYFRHLFLVCFFDTEADW